MKKIIIHRFSTLFIIIVVFSLVFPSHQIFAQTASSGSNSTVTTLARIAASTVTGGLSDLGLALAKGAVNQFIGFTFNAFLALVGYTLYTLLTVASFVLVMCASVLNVAIAVSTNLGPLINNTPAIYQVWTILRDIATLFLIFAILWAAFLTILSFEGAHYKQLLTNIVIVGILINFSFFLTQIAIDASNIVSLQLYNAISPQMSYQDCISSGGAASLPGSNSFFTCVTNAIIGNGNGGLATIITQSLDVTNWYATKNQLKDTNGGQGISDTDTFIRIILINFAAIIVDVLASLSFLAAAAACIWRICILILLLVASPLWIVGRVLPKVKAEVSDKWLKYFKSSLLFLPVYLLLMYVALKIITSLNIGTLGLPTGAAAQTGSYAIYVPYIQLFVGFAIIIFMINMPFGIAVSVVGASGTLLEGINKLTQNSAKWARGWVTRNTLGRAGFGVDKYLAKTRLGNNLFVRDLRDVTTGKLATSKFGTGRSFKDYQDKQKEVKKVDREIVRRQDLERFTSGAATYDQYKNVLGKMSDREIMALDPTILANVEVSKHLKKSTIDAIKKSEDIKDSDREKILDARKKALPDAIDKGESVAIKNLLKETDPEKLVDLDPAKLKSDAFIEHLTPSMLKKMQSEGLNSGMQREIAQSIDTWMVRKRKAHNAYGFIDKNRREWGIP